MPKLCKHMAELSLGLVYAVISNYYEHFAYHNHD